MLKFKKNVENFHIIFLANPNKQFFKEVLELMSKIL